MIKAAALPLVFLGAWSAFVPSSDPDFTGIWKLNQRQSELRPMPLPPWKLMRIEHKNLEVRCAPVEKEAERKESNSQFQFFTDGKETKHPIGEGTGKTIVKWEGSALLINTLISGPTDFTQMDRWKLSRDGKRLTIRRQIINRYGETESTLVYEKEE